MNKKQKSLCFLLAAMVLVVFLMGSKSSLFGTSANRLEQDARQSQHIDSQWPAVSATGEKIAGLIFYDEAGEAFTFSLYVNRPGLPLGYVFYAGGSLGTIDHGVQGYEYGGSMILLSMNHPQIAVIELNGGAEKIPLDSGKPFVYVVPEGTESIALYDGQGQMVPLDEVNSFD